MLKHQKKRNVGLINEFFARYIAKAIIEHRDSDVSVAKSIFCKHFRKGTDLYRELKFFNALYNTKVKNVEAAYSLINEIKEYCKLQSQHKVDLEKTALLHEINSTLKDEDFFNRNVSDYKSYATIQVLLNHWRTNSLKENFGEASQLEDKLIEHLVSERVETNPKQLVENALNMTNKDIDQLVVRIMFDKLNKKFGNQLTTEQKEIVNLYVFSSENDDIKTKLSTMLEGIKTRTLGLINYEITVSKEEKYTNKKLTEVKEMILEDFNDTSSLNDSAISFYLALIKLEGELSTKEQTNVSA